MNTPMPRASAISHVGTRPARDPIVALAREFSRRICLALTPDELLEVRISNSEERDPNACHTFRFCEPERILDDASRALGLEVPNVATDPLRAKAIGQLRETAWKLAREARFVEGACQ